MLSASERGVTAIVLAAGTGSRFCGQKLLAEIDGVPMIGRVLAAAAHLPTVVVGPPRLEPHVGPARLVVNTAPERGMAHSLRLANAGVNQTQGLLILLADMPYVTQAIVNAVLEAAGDVDVCYPQRGGVGGHPVYFSTHARSKIAALADGDTIRTLRDDPTLVRRTLDCDDPGPYTDIDTVQDLRRCGQASSLWPLSGEILRHTS